MRTFLLICFIIFLKIHGYQVSSATLTISSDAAQIINSKTEGDAKENDQKIGENTIEKESLIAQKQNALGSKRNLKNKKNMKSKAALPLEQATTGDKRNSKRFNKKSLLKKLKLKKTPTKIKTIDGAKKTLNENDVSVLANAEKI
nr:uncharacterized protein LOC101240945 [Hydra vulgaris]